MSRLLRNSVLALLLVAGLAFDACADQELITANKGLVITLSKGRVQGYYVGRSNRPYLLAAPTLAICQFLFQGAAGGESEETAWAWEPSMRPAPRSRSQRGTVRVEEGKIYLQFEEVPPGCASKPDGEKFLRPTGDPSTGLDEGGAAQAIVSRRNVIGVRIATRDGNLGPEGDAVSYGRGALMLATTRSGALLHVRYIDPPTGKVVEGWIFESAVKNPFSSQ